MKRLNGLFVNVVSASVTLWAAPAFAQTQTYTKAFAEAQALLEQGETKDAIKRLEAARDNAPDDFSLCQTLVDAYNTRIDEVNMFKKRGLAKTMLRTMEACYALNSSDETAQLNLIMFHMNAPGIVGGDKDVARQLVEAIAQEDPIRGTLLKARVAIQDENFDEALSFVKTVLSQSADNMEALNIAGLIMLRQKNFADAMKYFDQCVSIDPSHFDCLYQIGKTAQLSERDTEKGIQAFQAFIENGHEDAEYLAHANYRLALLFIRNGNSSAARSHLEKSIELADLKIAKKRLKAIGEK